MSLKSRLRALEQTVSSAADHGADRFDHIEALINEWRENARVTGRRRHEGAASRFGMIELALDKIMREFERRKLPEDLYIDISHRLEKIDQRLDRIEGDFTDAPVEIAGGAKGFPPYLVVERGGERVTYLPKSDLEGVDSGGL